MTRAIQVNLQGSGGDPSARHILIITEMMYQGVALQRDLEGLGAEATLALGPDPGLQQLACTTYDVVLIDVDLGEHTVQGLAARLRCEQRTSKIAILVGWWDERSQEMQKCCDVLIYKPVDPRQLRATLDTA